MIIKNIEKIDTHENGNLQQKDNDEWIELKIVNCIKDINHVQSYPELSAFLYVSKSINCFFAFSVKHYFVYLYSKLI